MSDLIWVRIVIVTFNSGEFTQECVNALAAQTEPGFEVVIVDNGSTDGAIERLSLPDDRFSLIMSQTNSGFAGGSNYGLKDAKTPYVMTVNPDSSLSSTCLEELLKATQNYPAEAMFSPILFNSIDRDVLDGAGDSLSVFGLSWRNGAETPLSAANADLSSPVEVFSPTGAAALYRRDLFENVGGFDVKLFCYLEDIDLGLRLRARGRRCLLIPTATGVHIGGHSSNNVPGFALEQSVHNNLSLIVKSVPFFLLPIMLVCHIAAHIRFQSRNVGTSQAAIRKKGFRKGLGNFPVFIIDRLRREPYPFGASLWIARALSWSIKEVNNRPLKTLSIEL